MAKPFISLHDVAFRWLDKILFDGLCWEICDDQHWAIVGPNGSGKSALMSALCGAAPIVKGNIVYHFPRDERAAPQDQIAHVNFESQRTVLSDGAFYQARWNSGVDGDAVSVAEYLSERGIANVNPFCVVENHADDHFAARQKEIVAQLELDALLTRRVTQLSNGERRRVLIARA
ncbi:MAG: ATP-binding cassette domain-containing protein, partial [Chloroflexota bacterium]